MVKAAAGEEAARDAKESAPPRSERASALPLISQRWRRAFVVLLILLGLSVRLRFGGSYGTLDMEWWKSWVVYAYEHDLTSIYGDSDTEIIADWRAGASLDELRSEHAREVHFRAQLTSQRQFWVAQPPLYVFALVLAGGAYKALSGGLENNQWFNFSVNSLNLIAAAVTALLVFRFFRQKGQAKLGLATALAYWLNPLVILNAPVQGYLDQLCAVWLVASILSLHDRRLVLSFVLFAAAVFTKPTAVLVAPVLLAIGLWEHPVRRNLVAWSAAALLGIATCLPFVIAGHGLSVLLGLSRLGAQLDRLNGSAVGLWYVPQYLIAKSAGARVLHSYSVDDFAHITGLRASAIGTLSFLAFTAVNVAAVLRHKQKDRIVILSAAGLQVLGSYVFRTGQLVNHYFLAIPLLAVAALTTRGRLWAFALLCTVFWCADFVFYGFGREYDPMLKLLIEYGCPWVTLALVAVAFAAFCLNLAATYPWRELARALRQWIVDRRARLIAAAGVAALFAIVSIVVVRSPVESRYAALRREFGLGEDVPSSSKQPLLASLEVRNAAGERRRGEFFLSAKNHDPQLEFRARVPKRRRNSCFVLRVSVTAPGPTELRLYVRSDKHGRFLEKQSKKRPLRAGKNDVYLFLTRREVRGPIRLDPGELPGDYAVSALELRALRKGASDL